MLAEVTSFNIAAAYVTELNWCDYCAEVEIGRTEGEKMPLQRWTPAEDERLRKLGTATTIAERLKRSVAAVRGRAKNLGIVLLKAKEK